MDVDGVICLGGELKSLGGGICPPAPPLGLNPGGKHLGEPVFTCTCIIGEQERANLVV